MKQKLLLVDADQVFYQYTAAYQFEERFDDTVHGDAWMVEADTYLLSDVAAARGGIDESLTLMEKNGGYSRMILCFTSTPNFRHDRYPSYKGGRVSKRKPLGYWKLVKEYVASDQWETRKIPGLEADDVMSILATSPKYLADYSVSIWSMDKDMMQVPHTLLHRDAAKEVTMTQADADAFRWSQALTGDVTDGYAGLKRYGPVKAAKALEKYLGADEAVYYQEICRLYEEAGETVEYAESQIDCACILRYGEYNFKTKKPRLSGERYGYTR